MSVIDNPLVSIVYHPDTHVKEELRSVGIASALGITAINDVDQNFKADFSVFLYWEVNEISPSDMPTRLTEKPKWVPNIIFYNFDEITVIADEYFSKGKYIYAYINWVIRINEPFELQSFPFDRQLLKVQLTTNNCLLTNYDDKMGYCFEECPRVNRNGGTHIAMYCLNSWTLDNYMTYSPKKVMINEMGQDHSKMIDFIVFMTRVPDFYIYNVVLTSFLIVLCSLTVVTIPIEDFADRMSITMTMLLTTVAFRFVVVSWVPVVPYLTYLDKYNVLSISMLMVVTLENFIASYNTNVDFDTRELHDRWFFFILCVFWIFMHIIIFIGAHRLWFVTSWEKTFAADDTTYVMKCTDSLKYPPDRQNDSKS